MQCKSCKTHLPKDAVYCTKCGCVAVDTMRFCPYCGAALVDGEEFCPQCKHRVRPFSITGTATNDIPIIGVGVVPRALATLIDVSILWLCSYIIAVLFGTAYYNGFELQGSSIGIASVVWFAYYVYFEGSKGATPGKVLLGLQVIKVDGTACDYRTASLRTVFRIIDGVPFCYLLGAVSIWISCKNQRLGDKIANTMVVKTEQIRLH